MVFLLIYGAAPLPVKSKFPYPLLTEARMPCENHLSSKDLMNYYYWIQDGGRTTADQFRALQRDQQQCILDYLELVVSATMMYARSRIRGENMIDSIRQESL